MTIVMACPGNAQTYTQVSASACIQDGSQCGYLMQYLRLDSSLEIVPTTAKAYAALANDMVATRTFADRIATTQEGLASAAYRDADVLAYHIIRGPAISGEAYFRARKQAEDVITAVDPIFQQILSSDLSAPCTPLTIDNPQTFTSPKINAFGLHMRIGILVTLDSGGNIITAKVTPTSTGTVVQQAAVLASARSSKYLAERLCGSKPLYAAFTVRYDPAWPDDVPQNAPGEPPATPTPGCFEGPRALSVQPPNYPDDVRKLNLKSMQLAVDVTIDAEGNITATKLEKPSGYPSLDAAALDSARKSTFVPGRRECHPVGGTYVFTVDFNPD